MPKINKPLPFSLQNHEFSPIWSVTRIIDEFIVEGSVDVTFLRITLYRGLTRENQINSVSIKIATGIFGLCKLSSFCSPLILLMAYYFLILCVELCYYVLGYSYA